MLFNFPDHIAVSSHARQSTNTGLFTTGDLNRPVADFIIQKCLHCYLQPTCSLQDDHFTGVLRCGLFPHLLLGLINKYSRSDTLGV
jgi:hypothetical protein